MVILTQFHQPESRILHEQQNTRVVLDKKDLGVGTVYISERALCWKNPAGSGFCIEYAHISMHAIATDPTIYPTQCIFIIIDRHLPIQGQSAEEVPVIDANDSDDEESEADGSQIILAPADTTCIVTIFNALNQCQTLNPDPDDAIEEEDNVYEDAEDNGDDLENGRLMNNLGAGGDTEVNHLSSQLQNHSIQNNHFRGNGDQNFDDDQFEDAD